MVNMLPSATDMDMPFQLMDRPLPQFPMVDMLLPAMAMPLPELPMVDMLIIAMGYGYAPPGYRYGYASTRTSYDGYASPSYGYAPPGYRHGYASLNYRPQHHGQGYGQQQVRQHLGLYSPLGG